MQAEKLLLRAPSFSIEITEAIKKNVLKKNYEARTQVDIKSQETTISVSRLIEKFFFFGIKTSDTLKSLKISMYKPFYDYIFSSKYKCDKSDLISFINFQQSNYRKNIIPGHNFPTRLMVQEVNLDFGRIDVTLKANQKHRFSLKVESFKMHHVNNMMADKKYTAISMALISIREVETRIIYECSNPNTILEVTEFSLVEDRHRAAKSSELKSSSQCKFCNQFNNFRPRCGFDRKSDGNRHIFHHQQNRHGFANADHVFCRRPIVNGF